MHGDMMMNVLGSVAQFEREMMLERQREGIARANADRTAADADLEAAVARALGLERVVQEVLDPPQLALVG